jgi:hypothetical protein
MRESSVILPKLISIDTSIFGEIAKDYYSKDRMKSDVAANVISHLIKQGLTPFISFHHVQETLQHENDEVVFERWSLIKKFPTVAWMCSYDDENVLGSIFDIHKMEINNLLENPQCGVEGLFGEFRNKYVKYSSGKDFVDKFEAIYCEIRDCGMIDIQRSKEIESLSHIRDKGVDSTKLSELFDYRLRSPNEVEAFLPQYEKQTRGALESHGDKKLLDPAAVAKAFVQEVKTDGRALYSYNSSLYEAFVKNAGVRLDQVTPETTVGELGYLGIYNSKVKQIIESLGLPEGEAIKLPPERQTTWVIWEYLDRAMKYEQRAQGSNILDKHMSILALYVDIFTVDKRVKEYFRQLARRYPVLSDCFKNIVKLSHYSDLCKTLDISIRCV